MRALPPMSSLIAKYEDVGDDWVEYEVEEEGGRRTGMSLLERRHRTRWTAAMSSACDNWGSQ